MRRIGWALLLALTLLLTLLAAGAVAWSGHVAASHRTGSEAFQAVFGGLGLGPAVDLSRCTPCFDPRIASFCPQRHEPLPGGSRYCPLHGPPR